MNLVFMTYNNYYNRIIKKEDTMAAYDSAVSQSQEFYDIQFNPNDGVSTEQIVNWGANTWTPDYVVVYDDSLPANSAIQSRWFVIEWVRTRTGQYKATLHRDVIADNLNALMNAPIYVEKATIPTTDDVAIYNQENLELNKIKQSEYLLKDNTESAWLVGYFAKNIDFGTEAGQISRTINIGALDVDAITTNTLAGWSWNEYRTKDYKLASSVNARLCVSLEPQAVGINAAGSISTSGEIKVWNKRDGLFKAVCSNVPTGGREVRRNWIRDNLGPDFDSAKADIIDYLIEQEGLGTNTSILQLDGKNLFVETGTGAGYYHIHVIPKGNKQDTSYYPINSQQEAFIAGCIKSSDYTYPSSRGIEPCVQKQIYYSSYRIDLEPFTPTAATTLEWPTGVNLLQDAPYGMFAIPASQINIYENNALLFKTTDENSSLNMMCTIAEHLGAYCYDIQKLPYCPNRYIVNDIKGSIDVSKLAVNKDYALIKNNEESKQIVLFLKTSTFTFDIQHRLSIPRYVLDDHEDTDVEDYKIANQCDSYRLYSPNWAATFEFNLAKTGEINTFNVDCTYKPYNPYIHINPVWGKLYGQDFDDYRGLIAQGDFSIPRINDRWTEYQINNKNYLNSFNRQIDSLELQHDIQRKQQLLSATAGTMAGGVAGAAAGAKTGNPIAGAVMGTAASAIGGALDVKYGEMLRNDALDLRVDQFNYSLQNIQALPDTIAKVSTYDANNKIFPLLEYYSCTYQEKVAFLNKMIYNGMTIMRIGTLNEFMDTERHYFKGRLIRCEALADDFHILTAIADELYKGVFI